MSVIRVDNVGPSSGGTAKSLVRGTASAWANLNGTGTIALRDSENVSSVVDEGTGNYGLNFTSAFASVNFSSTTTTGNGVSIAGAVTTPTNKTVLRQDIYTWLASLTLADTSNISLTSFGDLA